MHAIHEVECIVSGRVQMVMYRDFAIRHARRYGIVGTVQNLSEGTVRVIAQGAHDTLLHYIDDLKRGPMFAKVGDVHTTWREPTTAYESFSIVY